MTVPATASSTYTPGGPPVRGTVELCAVADISDDAKVILAKLNPPPAPKAFISILIEHDLNVDAIRLLAHALPKREAVWWAWVCARKSAGAQPAPPIRAAIDATERWVVQPSEENRRLAMKAGEAADFGTAAGCAALAAFMTSGSLAPPDAPIVPPGEFLCAKAVSGSVTMAAVSEPKLAAEKFKEFVNLGLEVADRTKLWEGMR